MSNELWLPPHHRQSVVRGTNVPVAVFDWGFPPLGPYTVDSEGVLPAKIFKGSWLMLPEELRDNDPIGVNHFVDWLINECETHGIYILPSTQATVRITAYFAAMGLEREGLIVKGKQLHESVEAIERYRTNRQSIPTEAVVSPHPGGHPKLNNGLTHDKRAPTRSIPGGGTRSTPRRAG